MVRLSKSLSVLVTRHRAPFVSAFLLCASRSDIRPTRPRQAVFELVEGASRPVHGIGLGVHALLASAALLGDQAGALEHGDMLLHRREAHRVRLGQLRHRRLARDAAAKDVAPGRVGQRVEQLVRSLVG